MNIAVIFAGGTGQRMNTKTRPKQFLELHGKPILIYTLESFQNCEIIDSIIVVMLKDWISYTRDLIDRYRINKVNAIVPGGETGQASIFNGVKKASELYSKESIVLIHDGVRPLMDTSTIERCITCVENHGTAITVSPAIETVAIKDEDGAIGDILPRSNCLIAKAPQCFYLGELYSAHLQAIKDGHQDFIDSASLMQFYGRKLYSVEGPVENIKITTPSDYYIFRAISDARENSQIFGI